MENEKSIYFSLDEARRELQKRRSDRKLMEKIQADLGEQMWPIFKGEPMGVLTKYLPSPDNSLTFFTQMARYVGTQPIVLEFLGDKFVSFNEEKKGLGRLRVKNEKGDKFTVDIIDFKTSENKKISEIMTKTGESLVDFHHNLLKKFRYDVKFEDSTSWLREAGKKIDYYKYLLHFVAHGVLFEYYTEEDEREKVFVRNIVLPNIEKIYNKYGIKPLIIKLYPEKQTKEEDFYWWSYPSNMNDYIMEYANANGLSLNNLYFDSNEISSEEGIDKSICEIEDPDVLFSRVVAISERLISDYYGYYVGIPSKEIKQEAGTNPQLAKTNLAYRIVEKYFGKVVAEKAKKYFLESIADSGISDKLFEVVVAENNTKLIDLLLSLGLVASDIDARRKIKQGAVQINKQKVDDKERILTRGDDDAIVRVGKLGFIKIKFK
ncbi:MAG: hypothetical protein HGA61_00365 [Candidatus Moranbacteria bacterium]|nr:hypothetical protein [Candidatus Moranbacteria bacterium]